MAKSTAEVLNEIEGVTRPLEKTLNALAENPNGSPGGKKTAGDNAKALKEMHEKCDLVAQLASQQTNTQSAGMGMRRGGSSAPDDRTKDK